MGKEAFSHLCPAFAPSVIGLSPSPSLLGTPNPEHLGITHDPALPPAFAYAVPNTRGCLHFQAPLSPEWQSSQLSAPSSNIICPVMFTTPWFLLCPIQSLLLLSLGTV